MLHEAGVLTRELGVRVINVSGSGCLIETGRRMEVGTVGRLRLRFGGVDYDDDIQVVRCQPIQGAGARYHIGVRFLWTTPRLPGSIRHAVMRRALEISDTMPPVRLM